MADAEGGKDESGGGAEGRIIVWEHVAENVYFVSISRNSSDSYGQPRVSDIKNKTIEQLVALRDIGLNEVPLGVESGDDWTLQRIDKGCTAADILEQCHKLEEAGIAYWVTFLNGVAGREHSRDHAINSAAGREEVELR